METRWFSRWLLSLVWLALVGALPACSRYEANYAPAPAMEEAASWGGAPGAPPPPSAPMDRAGASMSKASLMSAADAAPEPAADEKPAAEAPAPRMVHYNGHLRLRVVDPAEALTRAAEKAVAAGGYVERLGSTAVSVRVPVALFDAVLADLTTLGELLDRHISAEDVTDAYMSVDLRLRTARETRARLEALLAQARTEEEKLQLLFQIQRVTDEIEQLEMSIKTLESLASFSRITVEVEPRLAPGSVPVEGEARGLAWIRELTPFTRTPVTRGRLELSTPDGMVALSEKGPYVAEGPDGAVIWTSLLENLPEGDSEFWFLALQLRLSKDFAVAEPLELGGYKGLRLVDRGASPYTWILAVQTAGKDLRLIQIYYPSAEVEARYKDKVLEAIKAQGKV